jgi:pimeloyl-ACP methyl ester carboxylesterase
LSDFPADEAQELAARFLPFSLIAASQPVRAAAYLDIPSTYVISALDPFFPPELQEFFANKTSNRIVLQSGHTPLLSQPENVAAIIKDVVVASGK